MVERDQKGSRESKQGKEIKHKRATRIGYGEVKRRQGEEYKQAKVKTKQLGTPEMAKNSQSQ